MVSKARARRRTPEEQATKHSPPPVGGGREGAVRHASAGTTNSREGELLSKGLSLFHLLPVFFPLTAITFNPEQNEINYLLATNDPGGRC